MISDTLYDAVADIQRYLDEYPDIYRSEDHTTNLIYKALEAMQIARIALDTPPIHDTDMEGK